VACPLCRQPTPSSSDLKINFALVDLLASIASAPPAPKEMCNECEEKEASVFCNVCKISLCDGCFPIVHSSKSLKSHVAQTLAERNAAKEEMCPDHHEPLKIFCRSDNTVICTMCLHVGAHKGHDGAHVLDAAKDLRERLQQDDGTLATLAERLRATAGTLAGRCAAVDASEARELARVGAWRRALVQAVEAREQALGEEVRQKAAERIGADRFLVVHLAAPIEVCRERDTDGHYALADTGEFANFPGVTAPYEPPAQPDLVLPTHEWPVSRCVDALVQLLESRGAM
jgi:hypothetical protein